MLKGILAEGVSKKICRTPRRWWSEHQLASLKDLAQKAEMFDDLRENKPHHDTRSDSGQAESRREPRRNRKGLTRDQRVMYIEQPSPTRSTSPYSNHSTSNDDFDTPPARSISDVVAAMESEEFDLHETTSLESLPFYLVCLSDNHETSQCQQMKNIASFNRTRRRNFFYWRSR